MDATVPLDRGTILAIDRTDWRTSARSWRG
jgi:hypothetical protein